MKTLVPVQ